MFYQTDSIPSLAPYYYSRQAVERDTTEEEKHMIRRDLWRLHLRNLCAWWILLSWTLTSLNFSRGHDSARLL